MCPLMLVMGFVLSNGSSVLLDTGRSINNVNKSNLMIKNIHSLNVFEVSVKDFHILFVSYFAHRKNLHVSSKSELTMQWLILNVKKKVIDGPTIFISDPVHFLCACMHNPYMCERYVVLLV